jgi:Domain of unknown function (DUF4190)
VQQPPGYSQQPLAVAPPTNTLAIVSLALGVASYFVLPIIGAIAAVITGHMARAQIRRTGEGGTGLALAGLILGYVHLALVVIAIIVVVIVALVVGGIVLSQQGH